MIRLFTSGTHKGLTFSNDDIENIEHKTLELSPEKLPIVLGHPKNDLPIIGYLPAEAIKRYKEGDNTSLGFDKNAAELSDESMEALRALGHNKISVRLREGKITHIGLVKNAAVTENNNQDFDSETSVYHTDSDFEQTKKTTLKQTFKNIFMNNEEQKNNLTHDFEGLTAKIDTLAGTVTNLCNTLTEERKNKEQERVKADFSAEEFAFLTDEQRKQATDFAATIENPEKVEVFKRILKSSVTKPTVVQGSVTAEFSASQNKAERSANDIISEQFANLK